MPQLIFRSFPLSEPVRNKRNNCQICNAQFGILTREHLCKKCFKLVCDQCSPHKVKIYKADMQHRLHRMCKPCFTESQILNKYIENNKLAWGQDSDISRIWQKQLSLRQQRSKANFTVGQSPKAGNQKKQIRIRYTTNATELWSSFNYSFRQFIGMAIDRNKQLQQVSESNRRQKSMKMHNKIVAQLLQHLSDVLAMLNNPNVEVQSVLYVLIFFMAHASATNAKLFTKYLVQLLLLQQFKMDSLTQYLRKLKCSQPEINKMMPYFETHCLLIVSSATCNYFTAEISIGVISILFSKKNYDQLYKIIAYIVHSNKQFIIRNANAPQFIQIQLLRNSQGLGDGFKKFNKKCQNQTQVNSKQNNNDQYSQDKSQTDILNIREKKYFEKLIKQNEELKIKNKNQEEQIIRLKLQNNRLIQREQRMKNEYQNKDVWTKVRKKSQMIGKRQKQEFEMLSQINEKQGIQFQQKQSQCSYQSYWQEVEAEENSNSQKQQDCSIKKQTSRKKQSKKLVKKYRLKQNKFERNKRLTTMSQKLAKQITELNKNNSHEQTKQEDLYNYQQIIYEKNERILKLNKRLEQLKKQQHINCQNAAKGIPINSNSKLQAEQKQKLTTQLQKVKSMNVQLIGKLRELSSLLMDKEQELMVESQQFIKLYQQNQNHENHESCSIF